MQTSSSHTPDASGDRLAVALYVDSVPRIGTYLPLARAITAEGHRTLLIWSSAIEHVLAACDIPEGVEVQVLTEDQLARLGAVDVFFSQEQAIHLAPRGPATVAIMHSLPDAGVKKDGLRHPAFQPFRRHPVMIRAADYFAIAVRQTEEQWRVENYAHLSGLYPAAFLEGRRASVDIVPAGYPKLNAAAVRRPAADALDHIIYSPTAAGAGRAGILQDGRSIIEALLETFPEHRIVLRPYPSERNIEMGRELVKDLLDHPRFVFDDSPGGKELQGRCAVMVTDSSSSAMTFSMTYRRPLVFCRLSSEKASFEKNPFGFTVNDRTGLLRAVRAAVDQPERWVDRIEAACEAHLYNFGEACGYLARHVPVFAARESGQDWLTVPRRPWRGEEDAASVAALAATVNQWTAGPRARRGAGLGEVMRQEILRYLRRLPVREAATEAPGAPSK